MLDHKELLLIFNTNHSNFMSPKKNCWEYMNCGRERNGKNIEKFGICPAYVDDFHNGLNRGANAGRICWAISGTLCRERISGTFAKALKSCMTCEFLKMVREEEGEEFILIAPVHKQLH
ncbi:hypothetical protein ES705_05103 [subsurface metagenome]